MSTEVDREKRVWLIEKAIREGRLMAGPRGLTAQWEPDTGARLRPWQESNIHEGRLQGPPKEMQEHQFSIPVLRKRTFEERQESLIKRLLDVPEVQQAALLQQIAVGYWKAGMPVTVAALRQVAADILNRADARLVLSNRTARRKADG